MAKISHFTQTVNGVSTTYDIHDANAIPRSGGKVTGVISFDSTWNYTSSNQGWFPSSISFDNLSSGLRLGFINIYDDSSRAYRFFLTDHNGNEKSVLSLGIDSNNNTFIKSNGKAVAIAEDVVPRRGGAVITGEAIGRVDNSSYLNLSGGTGWFDGATITIGGENYDMHTGKILLHPSTGTDAKYMMLYPDGTWTWDGTACQITSDQRLKQQIAEIDDKLLDAWQDVTLCQFKYNDAVDQKGNNARLHTGYVVQQIDSACKSHGVDVSQLVAQAHDRYLLEDLGAREWAFVEPQSGAMLAFKSFVQLNYSVAHKVVSSPVESSFVAYNKTTDPEQLDIRGAIKGTPEEIGDALDTLIYFAQSTELLNILTPEKYYIGFNLYKLDYKRDARDGVDLVIFDARLQEIRQVESMYTNVKLRRKQRTGQKQSAKESFIHMGGEGRLGKAASNLWGYMTGGF